MDGNNIFIGNRMANNPPIGDATPSFRGDTFNNNAFGKFLTKFQNHFSENFRGNNLNSLK